MTSDRSDPKEERPTVIFGAVVQGIREVVEGFAIEEVGRVFTFVDFDWTV